MLALAGIAAIFCRCRDSARICARASCHSRRTHRCRPAETLRCGCSDETAPRSLGGALGANIHGRGLALKPIIGDVDSFTPRSKRKEGKRCRGLRHDTKRSCGHLGS